MITIAPRIPEKLKKQILACVTEDDWDDEGAIGITPEFCTIAIDFTNAVLNADESIPLPHVSPSVFGTVTLAWRNGSEHLIVRPAKDSAYYRYESAWSTNSYGMDSLREVMLRVIKFYDGNRAEKG
jgi:hypothetical protein